MTDVIAAVIATAAWLGGVLVLVVMAFLPLLQRLADRDGRR